MASFLRKTCRCPAPRFVLPAAAASRQAAPSASPAHTTQTTRKEFPKHRAVIQELTSEAAVSKSASTINPAIRTTAAARTRSPARRRLLAERHKWCVIARQRSNIRALIEELNSVHIQGKICYIRQENQTLCWHPKPDLVKPIAPGQVNIAGREPFVFNVELKTIFYYICSSLTPLGLPNLRTFYLPHPPPRTLLALHIG